MSDEDDEERRRHRAQRLGREWAIPRALRIISAPAPTRDPESSRGIPTGGP